MANYAITINRLRVENKIVRGFRSFNIVKMLLFTTTIRRSSDLLIMKRTSKWDVNVICAVESENKYYVSASACN